MGHRNVQNNTGMPIYVGSTMIPAGESRDFEESEVPLHLRPAKPVPAVAPAPDADAVAKAAAEAAEKALAELVAGNAKGVIEAIPSLSNAELGKLELLEMAREVDDKPASRKTVLEAISEETLKRAGGQGGE